MKKIKERRYGAGHFGFDGYDNVGTFWVVTFPSDQSELEDILFECDVFDFTLQLMGGLKGIDIYGIYPQKFKREAENAAKQLLKVQRKYYQ